MGSHCRFADQERALRKRLELGIIIAPGGELRAEEFRCVAVQAGSGNESVYQFAEAPGRIALQGDGIHDAVHGREAGWLGGSGLFARVILHRLELIRERLQSGKFLGCSRGTRNAVEHPAMVCPVR